MSSDTKVLLVSVIASVVGSAVAVTAVVLTLVGGMRANLRYVRTDLRDVRADVRAVHERLDRFNDRLRTVEIEFGKVDRLDFAGAEGGRQILDLYKFRNCGRPC